MTKDHYDGALLEEVHDQNKRILEALDSLAGLPKDVKGLKKDIGEVKSDLKIIKAVVKDHSQHISRHDNDINSIKKHLKLNPA